MASYCIRMDSYNGCEKEGIVGILYYYPNDTNITIKTTLYFILNETTGEILENYPKLEYIKNPTYCEGDVDCIAPIDEHGYSCSCTNFIQPVHVMMSCRGGKPLNCTCLNNTCTALNK